MRLGIDFGTTRTLVACADRGNYPVVGFMDGDGDPHEHFPSVIAATRHGRAEKPKLVYGFDALAASKDGAPTLRSFKRALASPEVTADTPIRVGDVEVPLLQAMTGFLSALHDSLRDKERT